MMNQKQNQYEGFFEPLANTDPYFKAAFQGHAGSGKTFTAALMARGLHKQLELTTPIIIYDTEQSSKFLRPLFKRAGINVQVKRSRTLTDLVKTFDFCEGQGEPFILVIDSITHVYEGFIDAYKRRKNRSFIQFQDWGYLKPEWKKLFSDRLVNTPNHVIFTGRQGYTYDQEADEETGKKELVKTGVKMKAESDTAYEPDILVMMERHQDPKTFKHTHRATILKDRSDLIDGQSFDDPDWDTFRPVVDFLLEDVIDAPERSQSDDGDLIDDGDRRQNFKKQQEIWFERISAQLDRVAPSNTKEGKALRAELTLKAFNDASTTAIKSMTPEELEFGHDALRREVEAIIEGSSA
jgi:hypothetical protein